VVRADGGTADVGQHTTMAAPSMMDGKGDGGRTDRDRQRPPDDGRRRQRTDGRTDGRTLLDIVAIFSLSSRFPLSTRHNNPQLARPVIPCSRPLQSPPPPWPKPTPKSPSWLSFPLLPPRDTPDDAAVASVNI